MALQHRCKAYTQTTPFTDFHPNLSKSPHLVPCAWPDHGLRGRPCVRTSVLTRFSLFALFFFLPLIFLFAWPCCALTVPPVATRSFPTRWRRSVKKPAANSVALEAFEVRPRWKRGDNVRKNILLYFVFVCVHHCCVHLC